MSDDLKIDRRTLLKTAVSAGAAAAAPAGARFTTW